ncbi:hypothetical protein ACOMHN_023287 [Nucella lapillus]
MSKQTWPLGSLNMPSLVMVVVTLLLGAAQAQEIHFNLPEEAAPSLLGNVAVLANLTSVLGQSDLSSLQYAIVDDNGDSPFFVDQKSGDLSTRTTLDRESLCGTAEVCRVRGAVAVQSSSPMSAFFRKFTIVLNILDINDHPPVFTQTSFVVHIPENAVTETIFVLPSATDQDVDPQNRVQRYALEPSFQQFQLQVVRSMDALGDVQFVVSLKVVRSLDRETRQLFITSLVAYDGGNPPRSTSLPLSIDVVDKNDNAPQFEKLEYTTSVNEATSKDSTVLVVTARDADEGDNARVSYFMADSVDSEIKKLFAVSQDTGVISVKSALVKRGGTTFQFEVVAQDNGVPVKKSVCRVVVRVLDTLNDRPVMEVSPLFSVQGVAVVPETAALGRVVSLLTVRDSDSGRNGIVTCRLDSALFSLQRLESNEYKVIVAGQLDREKKANHSIIIRCTDAGDPPLSTESMLRVKVSDSNDNSPTFVNSHYVLSVAENEVIGTWVGQVKAQDADEGDNARLIYGMEDNGDAFTIDTLLGDIYTTKFLDRELRARYVFNVYAYDKSSRPLTASTTVTVNVADKNDLRPVFSPPSYTFHLQEHAPLGTMVGQVKAMDGDLGVNGQVEYFMVTAQSRPMLPIGVNSTGAVLVTAVVDYETSSVYTFTVTALDMGNPRQNATCRVTVDVVDNNDHYPVITFPSTRNPSVSISLDTAPGSEVAKVVAYDLDTGANGDLRYGINVANASSLFYINDLTGVITLGNQILPKDVRAYNIVVTVSDNGVPQMASQALLQIEVTLPGNAASSRSSSTNFKLVIALVCLTLLLALAVLTPLLFIYCFNRQRTGNEKHRHKILTRPGYQPERLEKKSGGDRITSVFTSQRDDTAIYSPQWDPKLDRETSPVQKPTFGSDREYNSLPRTDKCMIDQEMEHASTPDLLPKSRDNSTYSLHRTPSGKGGGGRGGGTSPGSPKWNLACMRENLAALHSPTKSEVTAYSCEGGNNPRYQCLDSSKGGSKKKTVNFEMDRHHHPSIMEEEGGVGQEVTTVVAPLPPVQAVGELPSPSQFSTFKPPHRPGPPYDDYQRQE